jgi:hypothetical protein
MSRAYRVSVSESLSKEVHVEDGLCSRLELLPILPKERLGELLAAELEKEGFIRKGNTVVRREKNAIEVTVDLATGELKVTAEGHADLALKTKREGIVANPGAVEGAEDALRQKAKESLEREAQAEEETLRQKVTAQLEERLKGLRGELEGVTNRVTAAALKEKAAEMGTVEEISEDKKTGALTIKVRV